MRWKKKSELRLVGRVPLPRLSYVPSGPNQRERCASTVT
jgi:hypothetical protein